jgi:NAD(P)-dependent dehydrogenase (short-subunit alcohol dehydrogenase family)
MSRLSGKVALVTGAASGIGLASARRLIDEGAFVQLVDLDAASLDRALRELGDRAGAALADVTDEAAVEAAVSATHARFGPIDVVFSNAGIPGPIGSITACSREEFARVLDVHVLGTFLTVKHAIPVMRDNGSIIVCSSTVGLRGAAASAPYSTAKHALVGFARSVAKELADRGIRVNTIHPGPTDTAFQHGIEVAATGLREDEAARAFDALIPLHRHARTEEIAGLVAYLASDESAFVTGATLAIDGGMSA